MLPAIFLDKDGTLIEDIPYNVDPAKMRLGAGVATGVRRLHESGFALVVVTNQSGVPIAGFYYCPHHPEGSVAGYGVRCRCRKPEPGMLLQAQAELGLDLGQSWLVGDILNDVESGRRAGCRTVLIDNGNETEWILTPGREPHQTALTFDQAAAVILQQCYADSKRPNQTVA